MRYLIDRIKVALWAFRFADDIFNALSQIKHDLHRPHELLDGIFETIPHVRDNCELCDGMRGVRGNENRVNGKVVCDYCHAGMKP